MKWTELYLIELNCNEMNWTILNLTEVNWKELNNCNDNNDNNLFLIHHIVEGALFVPELLVWGKSLGRRFLLHLGLSYLEQFRFILRTKAKFVLFRVGS